MYLSNRTYAQRVRDRSMLSYLPGPDLLVGGPCESRLRLRVRNAQLADSHRHDADQVVWTSRLLRNQSEHRGL